jgi:hypothetical protein
MARDDIFQVRHQSIPAVAEGVTERSIMNKAASQVVTDLLTQMLLSGYCFHMQTGTEDAPITNNTTIDDTKAIIIADCTSAAMMPLFADVTVATFAAATTIGLLLEADMDKVRYSSGGTVYVPEQMNKAATGADAANGTFYTIEGSDIVAAAKSAVPASVELARRNLTEDALADPGGAMMARTPLFSVRAQPTVILTNPGSLLVHFGSSADITGYGSLDFAQFPVALAW